VYLLTPLHDVAVVVRDRSWYFLLQTLTETVLGLLPLRLGAVDHLTEKRDQDAWIHPSAGPVFNARGH
jgi:hypothetical protein